MVRRTPVELHISARWFDFVVHVRGRYEAAVRPYAPDVLVVNFGINELQPWLAPVWLLRHLMAEWDSATPFTRWYRRRIAAGAWSRRRAYRRWVSSRVGLRTWQTTPARFEATLRQVIEVARFELAALVLVLDVPVPASKLDYFLSGIDVRHARFQTAISTTVEALDGQGRSAGQSVVARDRARRHAVQRRDAFQPRRPPPDRRGASCRSR